LHLWRGRQFARRGAAIGELNSVRPSATFCSTLSPAPVVQSFSQIISVNIPSVASARSRTSRLGSVGLISTSISGRLKCCDTDLTPRKLTNFNARALSFLSPDCGQFLFNRFPFFDREMSRWPIHRTTEKRMIKRSEPLVSAAAVLCEPKRGDVFYRFCSCLAGFSNGNLCAAEQHDRFRE
jgi:hypothetical protein